MLPAHVYIHVPFCARRCSYCDFSIVVRSQVPVAEYVAAVDAELRMRYSHPHNWQVETLYFGGGTPSKLGGEGMDALLAAVQRHFSLRTGAEVTLEANPDDVTRDNARAWAAAGVNRISLGVQSFDDRVLTWMHRTHDAESAGAAVETLRDVGINNLSLDLIFGLPQPLERSWERDLDAALALAPDHLSLYGLTVEPRTPLARWISRGDVPEPTDSLYAEECSTAHERLSAAGFDHYEVSNFARPGLASRHNASYWSGAPYAGVGPAAHGFDGSARRWNQPYVAWRKSIKAGIDPIDGQELLSDDNRDVERVYLGLRTRTGVVITPGQGALVRPWIDAGWATLDERSRLVLTPAGWLRLDELAASLTVAPALS